MSVDRSNRPLDVVVYGATGYTGRLVAEYMARSGAQHGVNNAKVNWAMAGRSAEKLETIKSQVAAETGADLSAVELIVADASDDASLEAMASKTKAIATTVGPYQLYGEPLLAACAKVGTDYVDLCGEPAWMRQMIDQYEETAKASGARIVFSCGFDSIPSDLGVFYLQEAAKAKTGAPITEVKGRVRTMKGTFSGGTAASLKATMAAAFKDPKILEYLKNPFALAPGFAGPKQPSGSKPQYEEAIDQWAAPFVMAPINTKNVHRTNFLLNQPYGENFVYSEMMLTGPGDTGEKTANAIASDNSMMGDDGPKPGEGPTKEERESGHYDIMFFGEAADGTRLTAGVQGDKDPGYGSTSKMIAEAAMCIAFDCADTPGGVWTPAAAMGEPLLKRLEAHAGLTFALEA